MPPTSTSASNGTPCSRSDAFACSISSERLVDLGCRRQHRDQDPHLAVVRCAQDRPQLGKEQLRLGQAEADRTQAQRGIGRDAREPFSSSGCLSAPMSNVRIVTGRPCMPAATLR